jgi:hypothetical protein
MDKVLGFLLGLFLLCLAALSFKQNKFSRYYEEENHKSIIPLLIGGVLVLLVSVAAVRALLSVSINFFKSVWIRCFLRVFAYTLSAVVFFFTFKVGPKAKLFHTAHHTFTSTHSSFAGIKTISDFLFDYEKYIHVSMPVDTVGIPMNITRAIHQLKERVEEIKNLTNRLDLQFTSLNSILFLDIWTLCSTCLLAVAHLVIAHSMDRRLGFVDWLFDLFCDLIFHMAIEIFTIKKWYYAVGFYMLAVFLLIIKEAITKENGIQGGQHALLQRHVQNDIWGQ